MILEDRLYSTNELVELLGISKSMLDRDRAAKRIGFRRLGSNIRYTREDIEAYISEDIVEAV